MRKGTYSAPKQPFNDRNIEETSRYIALSSCDYIVVLVEDHKPEKEYLNTENNELDALRGEVLKLVVANNDGIGGVLSQPKSFIVSSLNESISFSLVAMRKVISSRYTKSSLSRAYSIPLPFIQKQLRFKSYILVKNLVKGIKI